MSRPRVVVVGGGLAGLAAGLRLADAGAAVTLLEARPRLGGATYSFDRDGLEIDNGQHVILRCCTAYLEFLRRLGVADRVPLQSRLRIPVLSPGRRVGWLRRTRGLPAPLHLAPSLAGYAVLPATDRARAATAVLALRRLDLTDPTLDRESFGEWLARHRQSPAAVRALWDLITTATLNLPAEEASLALAAKVFQTGLLTDAAAGDIGVPAVSLHRLHAEPAAASLSRVGAEVRLRARVREVLTSADSGVSGVRVDDTVVPADAVVLATPPDVAAQLLPRGAMRRPGLLHELGSSPIVNVHLIYDRQVLQWPFAAGIGTPVQWVFDRSQVAGLAAGQYLAVSVSAAADWIDRPVAEVRAVFEPALRALLPAARSARVQDFFVTRERAATFRQVPGSAERRPGPETDIPGLYLAGAWTATGWPATMEGAVRSGMSAARVALVGISKRLGTEVAA